MSLSKSDIYMTPEDHYDSTNQRKTVNDVNV